MAIATIRRVRTASRGFGPGSVELPVTRGRITMPRTGAWHATLWVDSQSKLTGPVEIGLGDLTLLGTVNRSAVYRGELRVRVVAGADGLRKPAKPKHYTSPVIGLPLRELASDAGEVVSSTADQATLRTTLLSWTTLKIETGSMIDTLVSLAPAAGVVWRMLADGTIWVGVETWPDSGISDFREIEESPEDGAIIYGMTVPGILPGTVVGERRVDTVEHVIEPGEYRAKVWTSGG